MLMHRRVALAANDVASRLPHWAWFKVGQAKSPQLRVRQKLKFKDSLVVRELTTFRQVTDRHASDCATKFMQTSRVRLLKKTNTGAHVNLNIAFLDFPSSTELP